MTIQKAVEEYLAWKTTYTTVAAERYKTRLAHFSQFVGKSAELNTITGNHIIRFHTYMKEENYSLSTVAYSGRILKNFFEFWKGRGKSNLNPKEIITAKFIAPDKAVVNEEDIEDMDLVLDEHYRDDLQKKLMIHLLWDTGMRVSELLEMNIEDIQEKNRKTGLRHAKVRSRKSMRYNLVVWGTETNRLLEKYLSCRICIDAIDSALFINQQKTPKRLTARTIQRWVKDIADLASIDKPITPHSFRHGKAHNVLNNGGHIEDVQKLLRHVSLESSLHYININPAKYLQLAAKYL